MRDMFQPSDFARCASNPTLSYCAKCLRNINNSPLHPDDSHSVWVGPWIFEDQKCPSYKEQDADSKRETV